MPTCNSCQAEVIWIVTTAGVRMPLDAQPVTEGRPLFVILPGGARVATAEDRRLHRDLYMSHFATCPDGDSWRKRGRAA